MQKPMTCPPVWRWRLTLPPPSTLRRLIQRPVARSNLRGLNQTLSPCGTQGSSSLWTAMSGNPIAAELAHRGAVYLLPGRTALRDWRDAILLLAAFDLFLGQEHLAASGVQVDAEHVSR